VDNVKRAIKPRGHFIKNQTTEILVGAFIFLLGCLLLFDAFDARDKKMPWPLSGLAPW
jgi:hypothetical protein